MSNALIKERSPYLRQHAQNPVDWLPWGEAAFEKARREDKPVFLSIGYSTCHWCHVMARESFENKALAEILNHYYVSVKVDREERPDIDAVYLSVCQAMTGTGGWPLTILMTAKQRPFFAGTYFPKQGRYGRPGLLELLERVVFLWNNQREQLLEASDQITAVMRRPPAAFGRNPDLRLLQNLKEIEEPFEKNQIGSSAMAYKRNPMRSERIASLSRYVMIDALNPAWTASAQWFERTLDDSANKRVSVAEAFLATDGSLDLYINVTSGLVVYPKVIHARLMSELPFMATENIMMDAVKKGGDRQELHEKIRQHSMAAGAVVKVEGGKNDLVDRIAADPAFMTTKEEILAILKPENFVGRAPEQTADFLNEVVGPILAKEKDLLGVDVEINV